METRPGVRTTEFWLVVASNVLAVVQQAAGLFNVPDKYVLLGQFALNAAYAISRGVAKFGVPADREVITIPMDQGDAGRPEPDDG